MRIKPLGNRVLVEVDETSNVTDGGIEIPETARKAPDKGKVIEVGNGVWENGMLIPMSVKPGDRIMFHRNAGTKTDGGNAPSKYVVMDESVILGIIYDE